MISRKYLSLLFRGTSTLDLPRYALICERPSFELSYLPRKLFFKKIFGDKSKKNVTEEEEEESKALVPRPFTLQNRLHKYEEEENESAEEQYLDEPEENFRALTEERSAAQDHALPVSEKVPEKPVLNFFQKLEDVELNEEDGSITNAHFREEDGSSPKKFSSVENYHSWKKAVI